MIGALADDHRRQILGWLRDGPLGVGALVSRLPLTQPGVTKHLGVLERAGLIRRVARGRERLCILEPTGLRPLDDWLQHYRVFWEGELDRIQAMAEEDQTDGQRSDDDERSNQLGEDADDR
ncbi:MAG: metalloregulator ArsR/SmtB family transcription factor [Pseudomonadota bacterium]